MYFQFLVPIRLVRRIREPAPFFFGSPPSPWAYRSGKPRLTVSTVNVKSGSMQYWDSASTLLSLTRVLASAALPISFPAVRIDGDPYWDGGIYSNTPIEVVFDDNPRRDSIVFADQMWHSSGPEPQTFIQFASRDVSHVRASSSYIGCATFSVSWLCWCRRINATRPR